MYRQTIRVRPYLLSLSETERRARLKTENPAVVWMEPREYEVTYDERTGSQALAVFPYRSWIRSGSVLVYHRPERARHN